MTDLEWAKQKLNADSLVFVIDKDGAILRAGIEKRFGERLVRKLHDTALANA